MTTDNDDHPAVASSLPPAEEVRLDALGAALNRTGASKDGEEEGPFSPEEGPFSPEDGAPGGAAAVGAEGSLPSPDEARLELAGGGGPTRAASDEEDGGGDGESMDLTPAGPFGPAWSGSLPSPEEAMVEVANMERTSLCGSRCTERRFRLLWLAGCLSVLSIAIGTILGLAARSDTVKAAAGYDQGFEELFESGALHDFNSLGTIEVTSAAFGHGMPIPAKYTADGDDVSPPISWSKVPPGAKSLVLLMDDHVNSSPSGFHGQMVSHWVVYDVPPTLGGLPEGIPPHVMEMAPKDDAYGDATFFQGLNSWGDGSHGYKGPDPSRSTGLHYYSFAVFAVDVEDLDVKAGEATRAAVVEAMERAKVLGYGKLVGTYQRFFDD